MAVLGGVMSKIEFGENWRDRYDLYYGSGSKNPSHDFYRLNYFKITFISYFDKKMTIFKSKTQPRNVKTNPRGKPRYSQARINIPHKPKNMIFGFVYFKFLAYSGIPMTM